MVGGVRLPKSDMLGLSDPFATLTCGKQKHSTHVEMCTLDPEWGDEFAFELGGDQSVLKVEVFDWDVEENDFLGMFEVKL